MSFQRPGSRSKAAFGVAFRGGGGGGGGDAPGPSTSAPPAAAAAASTAAAAAAAAPALPAARHRREVLFAVESHATTILLGDTGSGKTTQVPRFLMEAGWAAGGLRVACTQPRRMAAVTVAARVADEMGVKLGGEVGYAVRFEDATSPVRVAFKRG
jgi:ATP-dependent RNA helicase DDX35